MILTEVNYYAYSLGIRSTMGVLLPQSSVEELNMGAGKQYRTLYLLHGYSDDHTAWQRWTSIERYAERYQLAVVMPSVHLSFYTDMVHGGKYWRYISEEIPRFVRSIFPLSPLRENNFVAGLSMGGYGAFKLAMLHPDQYAAAASLSGAVDIREVVRAHGNPQDESWLMQMKDIFGDLSQVAGSQNDLFRLAEDIAKDEVKPRFYQCCGTEDFLYTDNLRFRDHARRLSLDLVYDEGPGSHEWGYWDVQIQKFLAWLGLDKSLQKTI